MVKKHVLKRRNEMNTHHKVRVINIFGRSFLYFMLIGGAFIMLFPFIYMISTSFKPIAYLFRVPPELIPPHPTFKNYVRVWEEFGFARYFLNSVTITVPAVLLNVFLSSLTAYGFAKFKFPGKEIWFTVLIATLAVPGLLLVIPQFDMIRRIRFFMDNRFTIILTSGIGGIAFNAFFLRGFFEAIPQEMIDAAEIDGCNQFQIYYRIILPLSKPALATLAILSTLGTWDDYFWPSLILSSESKWTLPLGIVAFQGEHGVQWNMVFAASIIALIPVTIVYIVFQKYFIRAVAGGGLKM